MKDESAMNDAAWEEFVGPGPEELEYLGTVDAVARLLEEE